MAYDDRAAVAAKIDHEGGIWEALEYGLQADDMPDGDTELRAAWTRLSEAFAAAKTCADAVFTLLPDPWAHSGAD